MRSAPTPGRSCSPRWAITWSRGAADQPGRGDPDRGALAWAARRSATTASTAPTIRATTPAWLSASDASRGDPLQPGLRYAARLRRPDPARLRARSNGAKVEEPGADFDDRRLALHCARCRVGVSRQGLPDAAQAGRHRVLAEALDLPEHLHVAALATAPAPEQGRGAGRAGHRPTRPGHDRPAPADRRRPVHPPHGLAPKHHVPKVYEVTVKHARRRRRRLPACWPAWCSTTTPRPVRAAACEIRPARLQLSLTLTEGKYHQVKRMLAAVGNRVEALHRSRIGEPRCCPTELAPGQWRWLGGAGGRRRCARCVRRAERGASRAGVILRHRCVFSLIPSGARSPIACTRG